MLEGFRAFGVGGLDPAFDIAFDVLKIECLCSRHNFFAPTLESFLCGTLRSSAYLCVKSGFQHQDRRGYAETTELTYFPLPAAGNTRSNGSQIFGLKALARIVFGWFS